MKDRKAAGPGGVSIELVKNGRNRLIELIAKMFNKFSLNENNIVTN